MKRCWMLFAVIGGIWLGVVCPLSANELSGYLAVEGFAFLESPRLTEQEDNDAAVALQPEYYHDFENSVSVTIVPFARYDYADKERTHFDLREMNMLIVEDQWELRFGVGKVFWGVTEFVHLVDIINQTDAVEALDGEDKLGQPMVRLTLARDYGVFSFFALPYFRERTYPGSEGRLRTDLPVDWDNALYESRDENHHVDFAVRYSHSIGDWDFGIYHFNGTSRDPSLRPMFNRLGMPVALQPYYEQIKQTGLDAQVVLGEWLLKLESIYRVGQSNRVYQKEDYFAAVGGFEYTFVRIFNTAMDVGVIGEWAYDERGDKATSGFQNDLMAGLRWTVNDAASTEFLAGYAQDLDNVSKLFSVEASRRFGDNWKLNLEMRAFFDPADTDILYPLRDDDFLRIELAYYF